MDVEKTIQFLIDNAAHHDAAIVELKNAVRTMGDTLGEGLIKLTDIVKGLAEAVAEHDRLLAEHERMMLEHERYALEQDAKSRERDAKLDERIDKLLLAITAQRNGGSNPPLAQA